MEPDFHEYADGLVDGPVRGRGAGLNPGSRFESVRLHVLGEHLDAERSARAAEGADPDRGRPVATEVLADHARRLIHRVDPEKSPDIGFRWTVNPYRGCEHGCVYCYARPGHETFGLSGGLDFETKLFAKREAPEMLRRELARPRWRGEPIVMSGVTDCYQPVEKALELTRRMLEVFATCRQPVSVVTKSGLVLRDLDRLAELARFGAVHVSVSVTTLDARLASALEPRAASPARRLETIRALSAAGIPVAAMVAPVIPGMTDREIPAMLEAVREAGAHAAGWVLLRLPWQNRALFLDWLGRHAPERASHVESLIRECRGGGLYDPSHGKRFRGEGPVAEQIAALFELFAARHGLARRMRPLASEHFRRPETGGQMRLF